jgi:UDP-N-acetylmuramate--alanine ligase
VLFQPHRYSRTDRFRHEFADALATADNVGLLPVYAASEEPIAGVGSELIRDGLVQRGQANVTLLSGPEDVPAWLDTQVESGDLLLILGAGDIGRLVQPICEQLQSRREG